MRRAPFFIGLIFSLPVFSQHCPWDCSGMILIKTDASKPERQHPVLVDEGKREITDTMYGTGLETNDPCRFLSYEDFTKERTKKMAIHHWYGHDTVYHFAKGYYIVRYNHCKYKNKRLYVQFQAPYDRGITHHYIEVPDSTRVHLHDYSRYINERNSTAIGEAIRNRVLVIKCEDWLLKPEDCKTQ